MCHCGITRKSHQKLRDDQPLAVQAESSCAESEPEPVDILPGTGATGTFYAERGSHSKLGYLSGTGARAAQNFAGFASTPGMRSRNRSRSTLHGARIGAARTS